MKLLRKILFPFSLLYGALTAIRNFFYDKGWWESRRYPIPVICVGNLSVGGTGKSPMIEYLIDFLKDDYQIAVLSRGYKRKSKGYLEVLEDHTAIEVGDEPLQIKQKYPRIRVVVCADRREGIEKLKSKADLILMDDGFQHRRVKPSFSILLTPFHDLYINDYFLPTGNLREPKSGANRAEMIVVTKCPEGTAYAKLQEIQFKIKPRSNQNIFFSKIGYDPHIYGASETLPLHYLQDKKFTLVTGIANPQPMLDFLNLKKFNFEHERFVDHHEFTDSELDYLRKKELIITTEKDFVRLQPKLEKYAVYYLPIRTEILNEQGAFFKQLVKASIRDFKK